MTYDERIAAFNETPMTSYIMTWGRCWLEENGFFTAPASTKYHGAYEGGLFDHSLAVTNALVDLTAKNQLIWSRPDSPYIIGMLHDICKIDQYRHPDSPILADGHALPDTTKWEYNPNTLLKGHGDKSVMLASTLLTLTEEEMLCIRYHMGAFSDKEEWTQYTAAIHKYSNVLWMHQADMIAAHVQMT